MMLNFILGAALTAVEPGIGAERLMADVKVLAADDMQGRAAGSEGGAKARAYIEARLQAIGLPVETASFEWQGRRDVRGTATNLWTRVPGTETDRGWIVVTAHYDHVGVRGGTVYNGADDNASGVSVLLALAEELKARPPEHDVMLVWLDAEERGLKGAEAFVKSPPAPVEDMLLNVNLDMVSRNEKGELFAAGPGRHPALKPVLEMVAAEAPVALRFGHDVEGTGREDWTMQSDHGAFHAAGVPFVYFGVEDHADYHQPGDDAERIDPDFFARSAHTIAMALRALDGAGEALKAAKGAAKPAE